MEGFAANQWFRGKMANWTFGRAFQVLSWEKGKSNPT